MIGHIFAEMLSCQHEAGVICWWVRNVSWLWSSGRQRLWRADDMARTHPLPFGALLKRQRLARGLTQEALAERAGLSAVAISNLERGVNSAPRKETMRLLADALQLSDFERAHFEASARW